MVDALTHFAGKANRTPGPAFRGIGRKAAEAERQHIVRLIQALKKRFGSLHAPVIGALADQGFLNHDAMASLDRWLSIVGRADLSRVPRTYTPGRPKKVVANAIARVLARNYRLLTGKKATVPTKWDTGKAYGSYVTLVHQVFTALGVIANAEACARNATRVKRRKKVTKKGG